MYCYTAKGLEKVSGTVLILGDSISDGGMYVSFLNMWLRLYAPNENIIIKNIGVSSETVSGLSEPDHPFPRPCLHSRIERALDVIKPDWVVLCYGINDGIYYPFGEERFEAFKAGYQKAVKLVRDFGAKVIVMTPPPFDAAAFAASGNELQPLGIEKYSFMAVYENYNEVMCRYAVWVREELKKQADCIIDVYQALADDIAAKRKENPAYVSGDGIHPNLHGHWVMASAILDALFGVTQSYGEKIFSQDSFALFELIYKHDSLLHYYYKETVGHDNPFKSEYLEGAALSSALADANTAIEKYISSHPELFNYTATWNGYSLQVIHQNGYESVVACPNNEAEAAGKPWAWRTEFFGAFPAADLALLENGWHVVQIAISNQFGCPVSVDIMEQFYKYITQAYGLARKAALFGFSRGGLYALHYAAKYPTHVLALYLDAPVVDIKSWPGGKGRGVGSAWDYERCLKAFSLTEESDGYMPIMQNAFKAVTDAKLPLILVAGDSDEVVPFCENGKLLLNAYEKAQLPSVCILKNGVGHHPHSLSEPSPIVDFLAQCFKRDIDFVFPIDGDVLFETSDGILKDNSLFTEVSVQAPPQSKITINGVPAQMAGDGLFKATVPLDCHRNIIELYEEETGLEKSIVVYWFKNGYMSYRMSVDDVITSLEDIYKNKYQSLFENPFFAMFKRLHEKLSTCVQFHIYYQNDDGSFNLSMLPDCYRDEFAANSDWLKLTFHSFKDMPPSPYKNADYNTVLHEGRMVEHEIRRFAGDKSFSAVTAQHWGDSNRLATRAFRSLGYRVLQGFFVHDNNSNKSVSYYLDDDKLAHFATRDFWADTAEDIIFVKADIVINNTPLCEIVPHLEKVYACESDRAFMNLMTHEQYFYEHLNCYQADYEKSVFTACEWAAGKGYRPSFISDFAFEK